MRFRHEENFQNASIIQYFDTTITIPACFSVGNLCFLFYYSQWARPCYFLLVPRVQCKIPHTALSFRKPASTILQPKARKSSKMPADIIGFGYALTVAAGGIIGYLKAGTIPMTCCHAFLFTYLG